ncbi:MAG: BatD family protein [Burkholderiales bacterium]
MVKALLALACCALQLAAGLASAQPLFEVRAEQRELALGEPLQLTIRAADSALPLDTLRLDALRGDFEVYAQSSSSETQQRQGRPLSVETLALTLYPRHAGLLAVPALRFGGKTSRPLQVRVRESGPDVPRVRIATAAGAGAIVARRASRMSLDIYDDGSLQWSPPMLSALPALHIRPLREAQRQVERDGERLTLHRFSWAVMPLREGNFDLTMPTLEAVKFGKRLRYAAPHLFFTARGLPAYLPVQVPVGKPRVEADALPAKISVDRPVDWRFTVTSASLGEDSVAKLFAGVRDSATLRVYAPAVAALPDASAEGPEQVFQVSVPLRFRQSGRQALPPLSFPYYDPDSGRIEAVVLPAVGVDVVNPLRRKLGLAAAALAGLAASVWLFRAGRRRLRAIRARRRAIRAVAAAQTPADLRLAWLCYGAPGKTLRQWLLQNPSGPGLAAAAASLERLCYGGGREESLEAIRQEILAGLGRDGSRQRSDFRRQRV